MFRFDCLNKTVNGAPSSRLDLGPIGIARPAGNGLYTALRTRYQRLSEDPAISFGSFIHNRDAGLLHLDDALRRSALNSASHISDILLLTDTQQMWLADLSKPASARAMLQPAGHVGRAARPRREFVHLHVQNLLPSVLRHASHDSRTVYTMETMNLRFGQSLLRRRVACVSSLV
jgi:hypothetical protein